MDQDTFNGQVIFPRRLSDEALKQGQEFRGRLATRTDVIQTPVKKIMLSYIITADLRMKYEI